MILILSLITLVVLCFYAWDTHALAKASIQQVENAQMPFLALVKLHRELPVAVQQRSGLTSGYWIWVIQNQGNAAAINIKVRGEMVKERTGDSESFTSSIAPIPVGDNKSLSPDGRAVITSCTIEYESLDGRTFCTAITSVDGEHHFAYHRS